MSEANYIYLPFLKEENDYYQLYRELIFQVQERNWSRESASCYVEKHHIWPDSLDGPDESWNLVFLTASEHYYAHYYLMKMLENQNDISYRKMIHACWQMNNRIAPGEDLELEAQIYEETRKKFTENINGENHHLFGTNRSGEIKNKISKNTKEKMNNIDMSWDENRKKEWSKRMKTENPMIKNYSKHNCKKSAGQKIMITDLKTNIQVCFYSQKDASLDERFNFKQVSLSYALKNNILLFKRYKIEKI